MLALTLGLHWTVLQSVAWMGMLVNYSAEGSFSEAVVKTFDGNHPCQLCVVVDEGKKSEREHKQLKSLDKADWELSETVVLLYRPAFSLGRIPANLPPDSLSVPPPGPPPRLA
jgi:hypothetical protein